MRAIPRTSPGSIGSVAGSKSSFLPLASVPERNPEIRPWAFPEFRMSTTGMVAPLTVRNLVPIRSSRGCCIADACIDNHTDATGNRERNASRLHRLIVALDKHHEAALARRSVVRNRDLEAIAVLARSAHGDLARLDGDPWPAAPGLQLVVKVRPLSASSTQSAVLIRKRVLRLFGLVISIT